MAENQSGTLIIRIKGLIYGAVLIYVCYFFQLFLVVSGFLDQFLGENVFSSLISVAFSLFFVVGMISGLVQGLRQFATGKDYFTDMFIDFFTSANAESKVPHVGEGIEEKEVANKKLYESGHEEWSEGKQEEWSEGKQKDLDKKLKKSREYFEKQFRK